MDVTQDTPNRQKRKKGSFKLGVLLFVLALVLGGVSKALSSVEMPSLPFSIGKDGTEDKPKGEDKPRKKGETTTVYLQVGSEKMGFFADPEVKEYLAEQGLAVNATAKGSRAMANAQDLENVDALFPSQASVANEIARTLDVGEREILFYSPLAFASFTPIMEILASEGVASDKDGAWIVDVKKLVELHESGVRWRDLDAKYPNPRKVQAATTDIRTSNSAAMYAALVAWAVTDGEGLPNPEAAAKAGETVSNLMLDQGFVETSSAGPYRDYLSQGIGSKPLVVIYEQQFIEALEEQPEKLVDSMTMAYPSPTVMSNHSILGLTEKGDRLVRALRDWPKLAEVAMRHGFRVDQNSSFDEVLKSKGFAPPPAILSQIDPPDHASTEALIGAFESKMQTRLAPPEAGD